MGRGGGGPRAAKPPQQFLFFLVPFWGGGWGPPGDNTTPRVSAIEILTTDLGLLYKFCQLSREWTR